MPGPSNEAQTILNRDTDWRSSSAVRASSRTMVAVERVPSLVCNTCDSKVAFIAYNNTDILMQRF